MQFIGKAPGVGCSAFFKQEPWLPPASSGAGQDSLHRDGERASPIRAHWSTKSVAFHPEPDCLGTPRWHRHIMMAITDAPLAPASPLDLLSPLARVSLQVPCCPFLVRILDGAWCVFGVGHPSATMLVLESKLLPRRLSSKDGPQASYCPYNATKRARHHTPSFRKLGSVKARVRNRDRKENPAAFPDELEPGTFGYPAQHVQYASQARIQGPPAATHVRQGLAPDGEENVPWTVTQLKGMPSAPLT